MVCVWEEGWGVVGVRGGGWGEGWERGWEVGGEGRIGGVSARDGAMDGSIGKHNRRSRNSFLLSEVPSHALGLAGPGWLGW